VFARGGVILPLQKNETTTAASRRNAFQLAVFGAEASGMLFWDDGETTGTFNTGSFYHAVFQFRDASLVYVANYNDTQWMEKSVLEEVRFHGVASAPSRVTVDGGDVDGSTVSFDADVGLLTVQVQLDMADNHQVQLVF